MINLFIDANIWLSLYDYKKDTLKEFEKLNTLLDSQIKLYVSEQVYNEFLRNRDGRIKEAWDRFTQKNLQFNNAPTFCRDYSEYNEFNKQYSELNKKYNELIQKIDCDIRNHSLEADKLLASLFNEIKKVESSQDIIERAERRSKTGNPPGKKDSIGDAINWELLLQNVPDGEDLYLISEDGDYSSRYDKNVFNSFLKNEWEDKKKSKVLFFTTLHGFLDVFSKSLESEKETSEPSDADIEKEQLRKRIMHISESMKKEMKENVERHQKDSLSESFFFEFKDRGCYPLAGFFSKYFGQNNSNFSTISDQAFGQQEEDCSQTSINNPDNCDKNDDKENTQTLDCQDIDQKQDEGDDDVIQ